MPSTKLTRISTKGFTLIELLVVIAIIGLLATIVAAPIQSARKKAKDTKKLAEVRQMQTSLANYANDNGAYPAGTTTMFGNAYGTNISAVSALSPQYIPSIPLGFGSASTRDKYMYVSYHGIAPGATATTTFGYHLGATLEVFNTVLSSDDDCWGVVSTTSPNITGNKNGGGCVSYVSQDKAAPLNPAYLGGLTAPVVSSSTNPTAFVRAGVTASTGALVLASSTIVFASYNYLSHPAWPDATTDFQGYGLNEAATSSCATVDQCIYDVSDSY